MDKAEADAEAALKAGRYDHASIDLYEEELSKAPKLTAGCDFYWYAFQTISTMRPNGMGAGRLRWDDTIKFADHYGMTFQEKENLWFIIRAMDAVVLSDSDRKSTGSAK